MSLADQLTVARAVSVPIVVFLFAVPFQGHDYWATAVFCVAMATDWFDGRLARRSGRTSPIGSLLDPIADKLLVLSTMIVLLEQHVFPAWMVAAIVARELLISGLRQAAIERGVVIAARDLGKLKTWAQAIAAARRRPRGSRRLGRRGRVVGAARRARADVGLRARLRALGARAPAWANRRLSRRQTSRQKCDRSSTGRWRAALRQARDGRRDAPPSSPNDVTGG